MANMYNRGCQLVKLPICSIPRENTVGWTQAESSVGARMTCNVRGAPERHLLDLFLIALLVLLTCLQVAFSLGCVAVGVLVLVIMTSMVSTQDETMSL